MAVLEDPFVSMVPALEIQTSLHIPQPQKCGGAIARKDKTDDGQPGYDWKRPVPFQVAYYLACSRCASESQDTTNRWSPCRAYTNLPSEDLHSVFCNNALHHMGSASSHAKKPHPSTHLQLPPRAQCRSPQRNHLSRDHMFKTLLIQPKMWHMSRPQLSPQISHHRRLDRMLFLWVHASDTWPKPWRCVLIDILTRMGQS